MGRPGLKELLCGLEMSTWFIELPWRIDLYSLLLPDVSLLSLELLLEISGWSGSGFGFLLLIVVAISPAVFFLIDGREPTLWLQLKLAALDARDTGLLNELR